jgi:SSS family solute:Na+ symporter
MRRPGIVLPIIALSVLFSSAAFAAVDERVARNGVLISIGFWMVFDFLTTMTGLYARALLPNLADPVAAYPALAVEYLPPVLRGLFYLGLLATVMSTVDGFTFIGGVNFGRDILWRWRREADESRVNTYVQIGFVVTAVIAFVLAMWFRSAVDIWHDVGSVGVPALLVPLLTSYRPAWRMSPHAACIAIAGGGGLALALLVSRHAGWTEGYPLGIEPIYPGFLFSVGVWAVDRWIRRGAPRVPGGEPGSPNGSGGGAV